MFRNNLGEIFPFVHRMYDLSELILVGSDIPSWLEILQKNNVENVHYINQSAQHCSFGSLPQNWKVETRLLAQEDGEAAFFELTNPMLNGTVPHKVLAKLWKNLETVVATQKDAVSLKTFIADQCDAGASKMVAVDSFDGLSILDDLCNLEIDVVALRVVADNEEEFGSVSQKNVEKKLTEWGYKNIAAFEDNHPKIKTVVYVKDAKQQTKALTATLESREQELSKLKTELESKREEYEARLVQEEQNQEHIKKERDEYKNQVELKTKVLQETQQTLEQIQREKAELDAKVKTLQESLQKVSDGFKIELENKIKELVTTLDSKEQELSELKSDFESTNKELQQQLTGARGEEYSQIISKIKDHINKSSSNVIKQIESFVELQQYVPSSLNFHGWPISPDIALFMAQKIEENDYDLIVEFGSGTSTMLFASMAKNIKKKNGKKIKVVTFEHNEKYYIQTKQQLKQQALHKFASVKYAPLTKYTYQDMEFMYYDCENELQKLKNKNRYQKILVLVDGPPGATGPLARFPALPHLLDYLTPQNMDLILDDSHRTEEKAVIDKWEKLLEERNITFKSESIPSEKGLYFSQINKKQ